MLPSLAVAVALAHAGAASPRTAPATVHRLYATDARSASAAVAGLPSGPRDPGAAPVCAAEVCQPRVAVPGFDPQLSARGRRTELALTLLERTRVEPVASLARLLVHTGLRLDYAPPRGDAARVSDRGWGRVVLGVRWRLDACNRPTWAERPAR